jgi:putative ABC transport system permease protein
MPVPLRYHARSLMVRRTASLLTVAAIGFTTFILILVLSLAAGFEISLAEAGREDNVLFLRDAAMSEGVSVVSRDQARVLLARPEIAKGPEGAVMACPEFYAGIHLEKTTGGGTNISVRGTGATGLALRPSVRIGEGRMFRPGTEEVVVGRGLLDSEVWGDVEVMQAVFLRESYSTVIARVASPEGVQGLTDAVKGNPNLPLKVVTERTYVRQQSGFLGTFLKAMAYFLASIMAVGAIFGSTNTLLASLAGRSREIGTLLALGYRPFHILCGFLLEALLLGFLGAAFGLLLAIPVHGAATGTTNWQTFTEQTFAFAVTPAVVFQAVFFAAFIGVIGGVVPAFRAAWLPPTRALRD